MNHKQYIRFFLVYDVTSRSSFAIFLRVDAGTGNVLNAL